MGKDKKLISLNVMKGVPPPPNNHTHITIRTPSTHTPCIPTPSASSSLSGLLCSSSAACPLRTYTSAFVAFSSLLNSLSSMLLHPTSVPCFMIIWCCSFPNSRGCCFRLKPYFVTFFDLLRFPSFWMCLTFFLLFTLPPFLLFLLYYFLLLSSFLLLFTALPPTSSAHVDMSTVAFDVDPLDLDAEEPPEFQGDPRSSKGMSGSVTSPQANTHRLPFFKKVTLGA